jgi:hypothetical protein
MNEDPIVAVGLLTQHDLDVLGQGFKRSYRVHGIEGFEDLLERLDEVEATPTAGFAKPRRSDP